MTEMLNQGSETIEFKPCQFGEVTVTLTGSRVDDEFGFDGTTASGTAYAIGSFLGKRLKSFELGDFTARSSHGLKASIEGVLKTMHTAVSDYEELFCNECPYFNSETMPTCPGALAVFGAAVEAGTLYNFVPRLDSDSNNHHDDDDTPPLDDASADSSLFPLTRRRTQ